MTRLFSPLLTKKVIYSISFCLFLCLKCSSTYAVNNDPKKSEEIKSNMWDSGDPDFEVTEIPDKWAGKSAVIIAKSNVLSYKKSVLISNFNYDRYIHHRVKLLDNAAVEEYSQFSIPESSNYGGRRSDIYAGFKIIKPSGKEMEIPMSQAVKQEGRVGQAGFNTFKLAIPNLETGDIIDYYMAEELSFKMQTKYYSFDPVILQLNGDYPIMKQKISFDVLRRCFINLKTLNGAPAFNLTEDAKDDKNHYSLVDSDRESVKDIRWLFPNRQLPTVKFKVTYASSMGTLVPGFIGEPGKLKSKVTKDELTKLVQYLNLMGSSGELESYMKQHFKKEKDMNKLARAAYYAYRNKYLIAHAEVNLLSQNTSNRSNIKDIFSLSGYYQNHDIPHEIIVGVPRQISSIDDLILENELAFMIHVKTTDPFYVGDVTHNSIAGEISTDLEGTKAYAIDANMPVSKWYLYETEIPGNLPEDNFTVSTCSISLNDANKEDVSVKIHRSIKGANRTYYQYMLMDYYSYEEEEKSRFEMDESFDGYNKSAKKEMAHKKEDYLAHRDERIEEGLKAVLSGDLDFTIDDVSNLKIEQTGRFDDKPEFIYSCEARIKGALKKVGNNYLFNIGKYIDKQIQLSEDEKVRKFDVFLPYARSFNYHIVLDIPEGYIVQGIENLNRNVKNDTGGFISTAKIEGRQLKVETLKYYNQNFEKQNSWPLMVKFLETAYDFTQQQVLLKKID